MEGILDLGACLFKLHGTRILRGLEGKGAWSAPIGELVCRNCGAQPQSFFIIPSLLLGGAVMAKPPDRALRIVLRVFSLLVAVGSLVMIFSGKPLILRIFLRPPEAEVSTLLLFLLKELGGIMLMLAVLLWLAARDPVRNVAVIDALIVGLCILSVTPLISLRTLPVRELYPGYLVWGRSVVRLAIAALLYFLRPRESRLQVWGAGNPHL